MLKINYWGRRQENSFEVRPGLSWLSTLEVFDVLISHRNSQNWKNAVEDMPKKEVSELSVTS